MHVSLCSFAANTPKLLIRLSLGNIGVGPSESAVTSVKQSVTEKWPLYFDEQEPPLIAYIHRKANVIKFFIFSLTLLNQDNNAFHNSPSQCECETSWT